MSEVIHDELKAIMAEPMQTAAGAGVDAAIDHQVGGGLLGRVLKRIFRNPEVGSAADQALNAGVPWGQILAAILPLVLSALFGGGTLNIQAIIQAILALFNPPAPPTPAPAA